MTTEYTRGECEQCGALGYIDEAGKCGGCSAPWLDGGAERDVSFRPWIMPVGQSLPGGASTIPGQRPCPAAGAYRAWGTLERFKAANARLGFHFFDRASDRFFSTRYASDLIRDAATGREFFITTEKHESPYLDHVEPRLATIREALRDGSVNTIGEFQAHKSPAEARKALAKLIKAGL